MDNKYSSNEFELRALTLTIDDQINANKMATTELLSDVIVANTMDVTDIYTTDENGDKIKLSGNATVPVNATFESVTVEKNSVPSTLLLLPNEVNISNELNDTVSITANYIEMNDKVITANKIDVLDNLFTAETKLQVNNNHLGISCSLVTTKDGVTTIEELAKKSDLFDNEFPVDPIFQSVTVDDSDSKNIVLTDTDITIKDYVTNKSININNSSIKLKDGASEFVINKDSFIKQTHFNADDFSIDGNNNRKLTFNLDMMSNFESSFYIPYISNTDNYIPLISSNNVLKSHDNNILIKSDKTINLGFNNNNIKSIVLGSYNTSTGGNNIIIANNTVLDVLEKNKIIIGNDTHESIKLYGINNGLGKAVGINDLTGCLEKFDHTIFPEKITIDDYELTKSKLLLFEQGGSGPAVGLYDDTFLVNKRYTFIDASYDMSMLTGDVKIKLANANKDNNEFLTHVISKPDGNYIPGTASSHFTSNEDGNFDDFAAVGIKNDRIGIYNRNNFYQPIVIENETLSGKMLKHLKGLSYDDDDGGGGSSVFGFLGGAAGIIGGIAGGASTFSALATGSQIAALSATVAANATTAASSTATVAANVMSTIERIDAAASRIDQLSGIATTTSEAIGLIGEVVSGHSIRLQNLSTVASTITTNPITNNLNNVSSFLSTTAPVSSQGSSVMSLSEFARLNPNPNPLGKGMLLDEENIQFIAKSNTNHDGLRFYANDKPMSEYSSIGATVPMLTFRDLAGTVIPDDEVDEDEDDEIDFDGIDTETMTLQDLRSFKANIVDVNELATAVDDVNLRIDNIPAATDYNERITLIEQDVNTLTTAVDDINDRIDNIPAAVEYDGRITLIEQDVDTLTTAVDDVNLRIDNIPGAVDYDGRITIIEVDTASLKTKDTTHDADIALLKTKDTSLQTSINKINSGNCGTSNIVTPGEQIITNVFGTENNIYGTRNNVFGRSNKITIDDVFSDSLNNNIFGALNEVISGSYHTIIGYNNAVNSTHNILLTNHQIINTSNNLILGYKAISQYEETKNVIIYGIKTKNKPTIEKYVVVDENNELGYRTIPEAIDYNAPIAALDTRLGTVETKASSNATAIDTVNNSRIGTLNEYAGTLNMTVGNNNKIKGNANKIFGQYNDISTTASFSNIFGITNTITGGSKSNLIGNNNSTSGNNSIILGQFNTSAANNNILITNYYAANNPNTMVLGYGARGGYSATENTIIYGIGNKNKSTEDKFVVIDANDELGYRSLPETTKVQYSIQDNSSEEVISSIFTNASMYLMIQSHKVFMINMVLYPLTISANSTGRFGFCIKKSLTTDIVFYNATYCPAHTQTNAVILAVKKPINRNLGTDVYTSYDVIIRNPNNTMVDLVGGSFIFTPYNVTSPSIVTASFPA